MKKRKKIPLWFRLAIWGGMALFVIVIAWLIGTSEDNAAGAFLG